MKTTKKDFETFQAEFMRWVDKLGLKRYKIWFYHRDTKGAYASIKVYESGKGAAVYFSRHLHKDDSVGHSPKDSAKHEAIHLLLHRIQHLGECRYLFDNELQDEAESLVRILEQNL